MFKAGPAGYVTVFVASLPFMVVDIYIAGLSLDQSLLVRLVIVSVKVLFAGRYDRTRDLLIEKARERAWRKPVLFVDMLWWSAYCSTVYAFVLAAFMTPWLEVAKAVATVAFTAAFGGPVVGFSLDALKRLFNRT